MTHPDNSARDQIVSSSKWAILGNIVPRLFGPVFSIILARLLTPADYGVVGIASMAISLMGMIQSAGMGEAVIQRQERESDFANVAFWVNCCISLVLFVVMVVLAGAWGAFFHEPLVAPVLRLMAFQLLGMAVSTVPMALLRKRFQFRRVLQINLTVLIITFVVSIPLAWVGAGYWALAGGTVFSAFVTAFLALRYSGWRPVWSFDWALAGGAVAFGGFVLLENLLGWLSMNIDRMIVGRYLTPAALGVYILAFNLSISLADSICGGLRGVFLPALSRAQSDMDHFRKLFTDMTHCIMVLVIPVAVGLASVADPLTDIVYGPRWQGMGLNVALSLLVLYAGIGQLWSLNSDAYKAIGRPDIAPKYGIWLNIFLASVFLLFVHYGLTVFCLARVGAVLCTGVVHTVIVQRVLGLPRNYSFTVLWAPVSAGLIMAAAVWSIKWAFGEERHSVLALVVMVLAGVLLYGSLMWLLDRRTSRFYVNQAFGLCIKWRR
jgi:O-antigen/teichoic acid export membrane protein